MARNDRSDEADRREGGRGRDARSDAGAIRDRGEGTGGRAGPVRVPANEAHDLGNIARSGSGERKDRSVAPTGGSQEPPPGAKRAAFERKAGPTAKENAASNPRKE